MSLTYKITECAFRLWNKISAGGAKKSFAKKFSSSKKNFLSQAEKLVNKNYILETQDENGFTVLTLSQAQVSPKKACLYISGGEGASCP